MSARLVAIVLFWVGLAVFFAWDWAHSEPFNQRLEPEILALGSGKAPTGGHCSAF